jgi:ACS family tartrate transporter-like MFS transporter
MPSPASFRPGETRSDVERSAIAKISRRLLPLTIAIYFVAYIDRTNVGFAALTMNHDLGLSASVFGWGAGIFFLGYFIFEVPSNLMLHRIGARVWICRIMLTWGLVSGASAFAAGPMSFVALRFLLGVAEAGFFPGIILYFTYWYPACYRARVIALFYMAAPLANAVSAGVSGMILRLDGFAGVAGWKWIFIIEAIPAMALAFAVLGCMIDGPDEAGWLSAEEKRWLNARLEAERAAVGEKGRLALFRALTDARTLVLAAIYFMLAISSYGIVFFLPQIVKHFGFSNMKTGFMTAIPYVLGTVGMVFLGFSSDRNNERRIHLVVAAVAAGAGLLGVGLFGNPYWAMAGMALAAVGLWGSRPVFWPLPSLFLLGSSAAGGIGFINGVGNLGGFVGPYIVGLIRDATGSFAWALYFLAASSLLAAAMAFVFVRFDKPARADSVEIPKQT